MNRLRLVAIAPLLFGLLTSSAYSQGIPEYSGKVPPSIQTPDTVQTRIGTLKFFDGLPGPMTVQRFTTISTWHEGAVKSASMGGNRHDNRQ